MRSVATLLISTLIVIGLNNEAKSDFKLCNHTALWLDANLTYGARDDYRSVGAARLLLPGACKTLIRGPLRLSSAYYVAAHPASGVYEQAFDWRMATDYRLCNVEGRKIFFKSGEPQPCDDAFLTLQSGAKFGQIRTIFGSRSCQKRASRLSRRALLALSSSSIWSATMLAR